uniref:structural maintenance of chromosomes protein 5-like n=1 Tax=Myxine glutinosa TaxID=7769 RepID=UPI00358F0869
CSIPDVMHVPIHPDWLLERPSLQFVVPTCPKRARGGSGAIVFLSCLQMAEHNVDFVEGSIVRIKLKNFVTYDLCELFPGPNLNMIIGPNGSGKSSIVCAICLGLAGKPSLLGRVDKLGHFVKQGKEKSMVEIELFKARKNVTIIREIVASSNKSTWAINGIQVGLKQVEEQVEALNIQVENLCQFLPQEMVGEFAKMTKIEILEATEKSVGPTEMYNFHLQLKSLQQSKKEMKIMANDAPVCIIFKERGEKKRALKCFNSSNWETAKNAARRRKALQSDKFSNTSEEIRTAEGPEGKYYHSVCLSRFFAVEGGAPPSTEPSEPPQKTTRSRSDHPSTSTRGVHGQECIFCGQKRKRKLQKNEPLSQCLTTDGARQSFLLRISKCDEKEKHMEKLQRQNERNRQEMQRHNEYKKYLDQITLLEKKKHILNYEAHRVKYEKLKKQVTEKNTELEKLKKDVKPKIRLVEELKAYSEKCRQNMEETDINLKKLSHVCQVKKDSLDKKDDEVEEARQNLNLKKTEFGDCERKKLSLRKLLEQLELEMTSLEEDHDVQLELCDTDAKLSRVCDKMMRLELELRQHEDDFKNAEDERRGIQQQIQTLQNQENMRLEKLRLRCPDTHEAVLWLKQNKGRFQGLVFEPIMLLIHVKGQPFAKYIENHIAMKDLKAFVFEKENDMESFLKLVRELYKFEQYFENLMTWEVLF